MVLVPLASRDSGISEFLKLLSGKAFADIVF